MHSSLSTPPRGGAFGSGDSVTYNLVVLCRLKLPIKSSATVALTSSRSNLTTSERLSGYTYASRLQNHYIKKNCIACYSPIAQRVIQERLQMHRANTNSFLVQRMLRCHGVLR